LPGDVRLGAFCYLNNNWIENYLPGWNFEAEFIGVISLGDFSVCMRNVIVLNL
jgi:hypothetical protein